MKRYQVWLDGRNLHDIDPAIRVIDVKEHVPACRLDVLPRAMGDGQHVTRRSRDALSVTVSFVIREYAPQRRKAILQEILVWAQGSVLQLGDRPGQQLTVEADALPSLQSALKWTEACAVTFTARNIPYWEASFPAESTTAVLEPQGNVPCCPLDIRWTSQQTGNITLAIETPLSRMVFSDMPVSVGQTFVVFHTAGLLAATVAGQDALPFRTPESSDDLLIPCGTGSTVTITVDGTPAAGYTLSARGRWL